MPKQTFGGDDDTDDTQPQQPVKRLDLSRYSIAPDINIRDVFWQIMNNYATKTDSKELLKQYAMDRFALIRIAVGAIDNQKNSISGLTPASVSRYIFMMLIDAGWNDTFQLFMEECKNTKGSATKHVIAAMKKIMDIELYKDKLIACLRVMLRSRDGSDAALFYIAQVKNELLSSHLKSELVILARGDIGANQHNAIESISILMNDEQVRKTMVILLSHWDDETRFHVAELLEDCKDETVITAAKRRAEIEANQKVKAVLEKIK
jgi:hypothetical protein